MVVMKMKAEVEQMNEELNIELPKEEMVISKV